jgi:ABC-type transport system substrate-binding protein
MPQWRTSKLGALLRLHFFVAILVIVACLGGAGLAPATTGRTGGTLLVTTPLDPPTLDPALAGPALAPLWYATCATLTAFPDAPGRRGRIPRPEAAEGPPSISRDGREYVFRIRRGLRFSDGSPLTAVNFARGLGRVLDPAMGSRGVRLFSDVKRVFVRDQRLHIVLAKPSGDLTTRLALGFACPVPLGFPVDPAGVKLMVGSGPYYVARFVPGSVLVLKRNHYYRGARPHRVDTRGVHKFDPAANRVIRAEAEGLPPDHAACTGSIGVSQVSSLGQQRSRFVSEISKRVRLGQS